MKKTIRAWKAWAVCSNDKAPFLCSVSWYQYDSKKKFVRNIRSWKEAKELGYSLQRITITVED
jgi:hypothetical protein